MIIRCLILFFFSSLISTLYAHEAPVKGFAHTFIFNRPIPNATITILETGAQFKTDRDGKFSFLYSSGKPLTLRFDKKGYQTTQSATVTIPKEGLITPYNQMTFQIPSNEVFLLYKLLIGAKLDPNQCHVVTTVTAHHKTLSDVPHGVDGVEITLQPAIKAAPFYFNLFKTGILKGKTNPFPHDLVKTTEDGGVAFVNVPPRQGLYTIRAKKEGVVFSEAQFSCTKNAFINISPPRGPLAQMPING